jgi:hypothetical protein
MSACGSSQRVCEAALPRKAEGRRDSTLAFFSVGLHALSMARIADVVACIVLPTPSELCAVDAAAYSSCNFRTDTLFVLMYGHTCTRSCTVGSQARRIAAIMSTTKAHLTPWPQDNVCPVRATIGNQHRELSHELTRKPAASTYESHPASQSPWPYRKRVPDPPPQPAEAQKAEGSSNRSGIPVELA